MNKEVKMTNHIDHQMDHQMNINPEAVSQSGIPRRKRFAMHIYVLPNMVTTGNLFFGFYAIMASLKSEFINAAYAIVAAAIFDLMDGRLARLTRSTSKFGAEYDSLCDVVSFGVAPGILLYQWALHPFGRVGWLAAFIFLTGGALRLARFNVQANVVEKNYFQGLPIPMAAGIVASSVLAFNEMGFNPLGNPGLIAMTVLLGLVMVSNFRYRSFKDLDLKERMPFKFLVLGVGIFAVVAWRPEVMLFLLFLTYASLGAIFGVLRLGKPFKKVKASAYLPKEHEMEQDLVLEEDDEEPAPVNGLGNNSMKRSEQ